MRIGDKAKSLPETLEPAAWAAELYSVVPWCEPEVLRAWLKEWLEILYLEAEGSFVDKEPSSRALRSTLKKLLLIRLRGPQTKAWLQGHTAEFRARRENDANRSSRFRVDPSEYAAIAREGHEQPAQGKGDSSQPEGDGE